MRGEKNQSGFLGLGIRLANRIIHLAGHPQAVKQYRELPRHGHLFTFLRNHTAASRQTQPLTSQVRVLTERTQDLVRRLNQQAAKVAVARLGDRELGITRPGLALLGSKSQIRSHRPALLQAPRVLEGQDEAQRRQRPDPFTCRSSYVTGYRS